MLRCGNVQYNIIKAVSIPDIIRYQLPSVKTNSKHKDQNSINIAVLITITSNSNCNITKENPKVKAIFIL